MWRYGILLCIIWTQLVPTYGRKYYLKIYTADEYAAGTDSCVILDIYFVDDTVTEGLWGDFERGGIDVWERDYSYGDPSGIEIEKDGTGLFEEWKLIKIELEDTVDGRIFTFWCNCWVNWYSDPIWVSSDIPACYYIEQCRIGYRVCGGDDFFHSICNWCYDPYFSAGWRGGCQTCPNIDHCTDRWCTSTSDTSCRTCENNGVVYKVSYDGHQCIRLCGYDNYDCWPGVCPDDYSSLCTCTDGFYAQIDGDRSVCQLLSTNSPSIETCRTGFVGGNGETKISDSTGPTAHCRYQSDVYGNFQPDNFTYDVASSFLVDTTLFPSQPWFVTQYDFGMTGVSLDVVKVSITGSETVLSKHWLLENDRVTTYSQAGNIVAPLENINSGERMCLKYTAYGGGFVTASGPWGGTSNREYEKTSSSSLVCYRFDDSPPRHCLETNSCSTTLLLETRVSKTTKVYLDLRGWEDVIPPTGTLEHASGIEHYGVSVHEVHGTDDPLQVGLESIFSQTVDAITSGISFDISSDEPRLYCVKLEVKDYADNVRQARRFFLYDESTNITTNPHKSFYVSSARHVTEFQWQAANECICLDWKDYFYNQFYLNNNLLGPIAPDPHGFINGIYEQTSGTLPVTGTANVAGIITFLFSFMRNAGSYSTETEAPNVQDQQFCFDIDTTDGDMLTLRIRAQDIIGNSYAEGRLLYIDGSPPVAEIIGLEKDGYRQLSAHDHLDLSKMNLEFNAFDPHSGIKTVEWTFGKMDYSDVVDSGTIVVSVVEKTSCPIIVNCYCPLIGDCEISRYVIPLHGLVEAWRHIGNHNRNYYFTVTITNTAGIVTTDQMEILVDDSPPETGIVSEGPDGYQDIDYTSGDTFEVNIHGFIDHESGIKSYRVGLANRCLSVHELYQMNDSLPDVTFAKVDYPNNILTLPANFTGKYYVTGIALNNAMDPSNAICSDGISKDTIPPVLHDVVLVHARWAESIICDGNTVWFLRSDLVKLNVESIENCDKLCESEKPFELLHAIPFLDDPQEEIENLQSQLGGVWKQTDKNNSTMFSSYLCSVFPRYDPNNVIFLPNDHVILNWNVQDEHSQVDDFYVGFGADVSERHSPGIVNYISTDKKPSFSIHHAGIGTEEEFFIFLKAVNKAGLETILSIGPVIIDETPPQYKNLPSPIIDGDSVVVGWENDTFYDDEQSTPIDRISYEICHDTVSVTTFLDWRLDVATQCSAFTGGCLIYPLSMLQKQDTDLGLAFYFNMYVYNNAGHFVLAKTPEFSIPSPYPPAQAVVIDLDPENVDNDAKDVDAHFKLETVCAKWYGFHHPEDIAIEFGVGTRKGLDDIINFKTINFTNTFCLVSSAIPESLHVFVTLRATSSGGSTISSSDGTTIYNSSLVLEQLMVNDGPECFIPGHLVSALNHSNEEYFVFAEQLKIGKTYTLLIFGDALPDNDDSVQSPDVRATNIVVDHKQHHFIFTPFTEYPRFFIAGTVNGGITKELYDCEEDLSATSANHSIFAHWRSISDHLTFETAVVKLHCLDTLDDDCLDYQSPFSSTNGQTSSEHIVSLQIYESYYVAVKLCLNSVCLRAKLSSGVTIEPENLIIDITQSAIELTPSLDCSHVRIKWQKLMFIHAPIYQWSVATRVGSETSSVIQWRNTLDNEIFTDHIKVEECVHLPVHAFKEQLACVRVFTEASQTHRNCIKLTYSTHQNDYASAVYELDASSIVWNEIQQMISSRYIGDNLRLLHEEDIDFGTEHTDLVVVVLNGNNREVTWFLMTSRKLPTYCAFTPECKSSATTSNGYVRFPRSKIRYNKIYYICARAPESELITEYKTDRLPAIQTCSNGFVLDNRPPTSGIIHVKNVKGYINSMSDFVVTWTGFDDNVDASSLGYASKIKSYGVEIGSKPKSADIRHIEVGDKTSVLLQDLNLLPGTTLYVTVTARDQAGLETSVCTDEFMIDTTPPSTGTIELDTFVMSNWVKDSIFSVSLGEFIDDESSTIDKYITFLGSSWFRADIIQEREYDRNVVEINLEEAGVIDGHTYYLGAKARNKAGLSSEYVYLEFRVDRSPPTGGHVLDGPVANGNDIDYQTDVGYIAGHWKHFTDPQSGISCYKVGLGTEPYHYDVKPSIDVGLRTDITWNATFIHGEKYYITVEACNVAGLCKTLSSDGVLLDNSPPIPGWVQVGSSSRNHTYLPRNTTVAIFWTGFEDPHSGMDHYEACIGTDPGSCDAVPMFNCHLSSSHIKTGLDLPLNTRLYATVFGYNRNKQKSFETSNYFMVDVTPPEIQEIPSFLSHHSRSQKIAVQWEKSVIYLIWKFVDYESKISRYIISLAAHHEGHTPIEHVEYEHNINQVTINLNNTNWLHNGDTYRGMVTACNEAGLCTTAKSGELLIDSTPPHMGGLMSDQVWQNFVDEGNVLSCNVSLSWYGFHDHESGIPLFHIGVGRTFSENELSDGLVKIYVNETRTEYTTEIKLNSPLIDGDKFIVSVIAENTGGLKSSIARATFIALSSNKSGDQIKTSNGVLSIERHSCDNHFCNKACTCATVGSVCTDIQANGSCNALLSTESNQFNVSIRVFGTPVDYLHHITASSACLSAYWVVDAGLSDIKRFEWTLGLVDQPYGEGVFDPLHEDPWMDVAHFQNAIHCLPVPNSLKHNSQYVIHVKAWVTIDTYMIFPSKPVLVDQSAPTIRKGSSVLDSDETCDKDLDFTDLSGHLFACWDGVFYEAQGEILSFTVSLGTKPGDDTIISQTDVGLNVTFQALDAMLVHGQKYYFTVIAYNNVGLHTMASSDGFVVDMEPPVTGVVYNTGDYKNKAIQSDIDTFELSWHGFLDHDTGIKTYIVALYEISDIAVMVHNFTNVSGQTSLKLRDLNLTHNSVYQGAVKAIDAVGLTSESVLTERTLIDTTSPVTFMCDDETVVTQTSQNISRNQTVALTAKFSVNNRYTISGKITLGFKMPHLKFRIDQRIGETFNLQSTHDGNFDFHYTFFSDFDDLHDVKLETEDFELFHIEVMLRECMPVVLENNLNSIRLTQLSAHLLKASVNVVDPESKIKQARLGFGTTPNGYQLMTLYIVDINKDIFVQLTSATHGTPIYATVLVENCAGLQSTFSSKKLILDHTPPVVDGIDVTEEEERLIDDEKDIKDVARNIYSDSNANVSDNNTIPDIFNRSETLTTPKETEPASTPPSVSDADDRRRIKLKISWQARDQESGIELCMVSVGTHGYKDNLMSTRPVVNGSELLVNDLYVVDGTRLYASVKCVNTIGLATTIVSSPVLISIEPPRISDLGITIIPSSVYEVVEPEVAVQTNLSNLQFTWDTFADDASVSGYEYRLASMTKRLIHWTDTGKKNFVSAHGLNLEDSQWYTAEVRALDGYGVRSNIINSTILIENSEPTLTGQKMTINTNGSSLHLNWEHVFGLSKDIPTTFDVTVGTGEGYSDLFDTYSLTSNSCSFEVTDISIITGHFKEIYITVSSVYATGRRAIYKTKHNLKP